MSTDREKSSRTIAIICLGITILAVLLYSLSRLPLLLVLALGGAVGAIAASLWYLLERGKRITRLSASFAAFNPAQELSGWRYDVLIEQAGHLRPARIWREEATWHLESGEEAIEYQASAPGSAPAMADYELERFVRDELRPRHITLRCCGTCSYFTFSNISRQMSSGWVAYCLRHASGPLLPEKDAVHLWHLCGDWEPGE